MIDRWYTSRSFTRLCTQDKQSNYAEATLRKSDRKIRLSSHRKFLYIQAYEVERRRINPSARQPATPVYDPFGSRVNPFHVYLAYTWQFCKIVILTKASAASSGGTGGCSTSCLWQLSRTFSANCSGLRPNFLTSGSVEDRILLNIITYKNFNVKTRTVLQFSLLYSLLHLTYRSTFVKRIFQIEH